MLYLLIPAAILLLWSTTKLIAYYATTLGLLYYLGTKYDDVLTLEKTRELRDYALQRRISELTGKKS